MSPHLKDVAAVNFKPIPTTLCCNVEKVAKPDDAAEETGVPEKVPVDVIDTDEVKFLSLFPLTSSADTVTAGVIETLIAVLDGCWTKFSFVATTVISLLFAPDSTDVPVPLSNCVEVAGEAVVKLLLSILKARFRPSTVVGNVPPNAVFNQILSIYVFVPLSDTFPKFAVLMPLKVILVAFTVPVIEFAPSDNSAPAIA